MKRMIAVVAAACAVGTFALADPKDKVLTKTEPPKDKQPAMPPMTEEEAAWFAAGQPGEPHAQLAKLAGEWEAKCKWWKDADSSPEETTMRSKSRMDFDGRFLISHEKGDFMGMPFSGMSIIGYDNIEKQYKNIWIDNWSTGILVGIGTADSTGKVITYRSECKDPFGKPFTMRWVTKLTGPNTFTMEMYETKAGTPERKSMEMAYTRLGGATSEAAKQKSEEKKPEPKDPKGGK